MTASVERPDGEAPPAGGQRRGFRPDIEGLRAVAVLAVVLFHAGVPGLDGGYVGVDVFFVVSGFLITGMLWREAQASGTVRLARFYASRARRLLPAAVVVLMATVCAAAWLLPPLQVRSALGDAVAAAVYAANYRLAIRGTDYLAADTPPSPFQHYWSLGVEEQFYLLWPALLIATVWLARRTARSRRAVPQRADGGSVAPVLVLLAGVTLASFAVSLAWTRSSPPWAYFSLPSRAWELGVGGLVALGVPRWSRLPHWWSALGGWVGLGLIVVSCIVLDESTAFPGAPALLPVVGAALVLAAGCRPPRGGVGALLGLAPLALVGRCSYSWYLWHWPVLVLAPALVGSDLGLGARLMAAGVALGLAVGTLHAVENPLRFAAPLRRSPGRSLLLGGGLTAVGVAAALVGMVVVPAPAGRGAAAQAASLSVPGSPSEEAAPPPAAAPDPAEVLVQDLTAQVQAAVAASAGAQQVPVNLTPALSEAAGESQLPFRQGCVLSWTVATPRDCVYGDPSSATTVALVGDSHAAQWFPAVEPLVVQRHWRLTVQAKVTCPPMELPITSPYLDREYTECEQWRAEMLARVSAERPALVVVGLVRRYTPDFGFTSYDAQWLAGLTGLVADLRATGAAVLVLGPVPDPHSTVPSCLSEHLDSAAACAPTRAAGVDEPGVVAEAQAVSAGGGRYADLTDLFCTPAVCPVIVGDQLVFRDNNHLTPGYTAFLSPVVTALVDQTLAVG